MNIPPCSCLRCGKLTSSLGIAAHWRIVHDGDMSLIKAGNAGRRGKPAWNKGATLDDAHKAKIGAASVGRVKSPETRQKIKDAIAGKAGGYRIGGGRGKKGWYKGIHCDSSWELAFVMYHLDHGHEIRRCIEVRKYLFEGKQHRYHPDFVLDGRLVEVKGWCSARSRAKQEQHPDVEVISAVQIEPMLQHARSRYGDDFTVAYGE